MKNIFLLFSFLILLSCTAQTKPATFIIGKWQLTEKQANNGSRDYTTLIKDGVIYEFTDEKHIIVNKIQGEYYFRKNYIVLSFPAGISRYQFIYNASNKTLALSPVDDHFTILCDEGCVDIYEKR